MYSLNSKKKLATFLQWDYCSKVHKKTTIETEDNEPYQPIRSQAIDWLVHGV